MTTNHPYEPAGEPTEPVHPAAPYQPTYDYPYGAYYGAPYDAAAQPTYVEGQLPPFADPNLVGYPPPPPAGYPSGYPGGYWLPPSSPPKRRSGWRLGAGVATLTAAALVGGMMIGNAVSGDSSNSNSADGQLVPSTPGSGNGSGNGGGTGQLPGSTGGGTSTSVTLANAKQKVGVVTIVSTLRYQNSQSAGTGMILSSDGEVLTNNHVINGATSIVVTVASTGKSYRADVVGTAPSKDVAVIQLRNASGLKTAKLADNSDDAKIGDPVVGVGNAGGTGALRASSGKVTDLDQTITASDDGSGTNAERLTGLIQVDAPIISGDSGGPLYDASGEVIGMDTAASANPGEATAYAIPIEDAVSVADQIEAGHESSTVHIGLPAFLGVQISSASSVKGALVESLLEGPASAAGIRPGSVITKVGGTAITTGSALRTALQKFQPGDHVKITWANPADAAGSSHSATVTLASGPAD